MPHEDFRPKSATMRHVASRRSEREREQLHTFFLACIPSCIEQEGTEHPGRAAQAAMDMARAMLRAWMRESA